jgi:hypothetical protein
MDTTVTGSQMALDDLNDVVVTSASTGQTLIHNGTNFVNTAVPSYNYIINGAFDIWQRGTSFASATSGAYAADRWRATFNGTGTRTISQQAFTLGAAPEAGYEADYFYRYAQTVAGTGATFSNVLEQPIEDVRTLAGQTVTVSFWAKADATRSIIPIFTQFFGTGGSPSGSTTTNGATKTLTTSWVRYSATVTLPSMSGKTLGTSGTDALTLTLQSSTVDATQTIDIWGVQVEEGSIATPFHRNAPSIQAELAACQRYYYRAVAESAYGWFGQIHMASSTFGLLAIVLPVTMRTTPSAIDSSAIGAFQYLGATGTLSSLSLSADGNNSRQIAVQVNGSGFAANGSSFLRASNNAAAFIGVTAEL